MKAGIYKISFVGCLRVYIGQSVNLYNRLKYHKYHLKKGIHYNPKLQRAYNKYGVDKMKISVLERFDEKVVGIDILNEREIYFVSIYNSFKNGLNCRTGGGEYLRKGSKVIYKYSILTGGLLGKYVGFCNAGRQTGIGESNIRQCCTGSLKTAKGFHFSLELKTPSQVLACIVNKNQTEEYKSRHREMFSGEKNPMYGKKRPELSGDNNPYRKMIKNGYTPKRTIDHNKVVELYKAGNTQLDISKQLNCTQVGVSGILLNNGIRKFKRNLKPN